MSKPDWKDAPEWAQWLAMDENGVWYWYACQPEFIGDDWACGHGDSRSQCASDIIFDAADSLERRP